jgi:transcriptional regulator with XRE-family HTH domain
MKYKLVKHQKLSGNKASIYSVVQGNEAESFLEKFVKENQFSFIDEIKNILMRLKAIGHNTGARENFFKIFEGRLGDGVCALYDEPESNLRLYCIRYGAQLIIVGNGGPKSKQISAFQMMKGAKMETKSSNLIDDLLDTIDPIEQAKTDAKMLIAAKIADAMKAKGWRNNDLLKALKKENPSVITKWLSGTHNFTIDTLVEIGHALDINLLNLSEQEPAVLIYTKSVSQKARTTCPDTFLNEVLNRIQEKVPACQAGSFYSTFDSSHQFAQA